MGGNIFTKYCHPEGFLELDAEMLDADLKTDTRRMQMKYDTEVRMLNNQIAQDERTLVTLKKKGKRLNHIEKARATLLLKRIKELRHMAVDYEGSRFKLESTEVLLRRKELTAENVELNKTLGKSLKLGTTATMENDAEEAVDDVLDGTEALKNINQSLRSLSVNMYETDIENEEDKELLEAWLHGDDDNGDESVTSRTAAPVPKSMYPTVVKSAFKSDTEWEPITKFPSVPTTPLDADPTVSDRVFQAGGQLVDPTADPFEN